MLSIAISARQEKAVKKYFIILLTVLVASTSFAAESKAVSYKSGDETVQAVLYNPAARGHFPP